MRVLITGGMGYVGSWLIPHLLSDGHKITAYDLAWFGDGSLPLDNENLQVVKADIRDLPKLRESFVGVEAVIHLAGVSNDHSCQLDEALSTSINYDAFEPLVLAAKAVGVRRFIFASSSSVYGVSDAADVREDHPVNGLTLYGKYKAACEPLLLKHQSPDFVCTILRPATVCGYAPRMRFDLTANIMTAHAILKGAITVFGGEQRRAHLHMQDMTDCYRLMLAAPDDKIAGQIFNVGCQNLKVAEIAEMVADAVYASKSFVYQRPKIQTQAGTDNRSYSINSDKIRGMLGFVPKFTIADAVRDLCIKFSMGMFKDALSNPLFTNVRQLVEAGFAIEDSLASFRNDRYAK